MDGWWSSFFDETYATVGLETTDEAKRDATIDLIVELLGVAPGAHIFDQCCGIGCSKQQASARSSCLAPTASHTNARAVA